MTQRKSLCVLYLLLWSSASCAGSIDDGGVEAQAHAVVVGLDLEATLMATSHWQGGYCAEVSLTNLSGRAMSSWSVELDLRDGEVTNSWSTRLSGSKGRLRATPIDYNTRIEPRARVSFGFCARSASNAQAVVIGKAAPPTPPPTPPPPTPAPPAPGLCVSAPRDAAFRHPGHVDTCAELSSVGARVRRGEQPYKGWYEAMLRLRPEGSDVPFATDQPYQPTPVKVMKHDYDSTSREMYRDSTTCYVQALMFAYSEGKRTVHADNVRRILDGWSRTLERIDTYRNGPLVASWYTPLFARCAELVKYTQNGGLSPPLEARLQAWMRRVLLPAVEATFKLGWENNWTTSAIESQLTLAVYLEDQALFERAADKWRSYLPNYVRADGSTEETCRDQGHTQMGLAGLVHSATTLFNQGVMDAFSASSYRLYRGLEYTADVIRGNTPVPLPSRADGQACTWTKDRGYWNASWETAYAHFARFDKARTGFDLVRVRELIRSRRPDGVMFSWGLSTLRHGAPAL